MKVKQALEKVQELKLKVIYGDENSQERTEFMDALSIIQAELNYLLNTNQSKS